MKNLHFKAVEKASTLVWLSLFITIIIDTVVQMVWKSAVLAVPESADFSETLHTLVTQPLFYLLLLLFAIQFTCWILLLSRTDLSYAQPITALSFVSVAVCSALFFSEKVGIMRIAGIAMIIVGVWFISSTNHRTQQATEALP